jgi:hypothetical protein
MSNDQETRAEKRTTLTLLKTEQQLRYDPATGDNNLEDFVKNLEIALKVHFGIYAKVVRKGKIEPDWEQVIPELEAAQEQALTADQRKARRDGKKLVDGWNEAKARLVPHIVGNITASSQQRIDERHREEFTNACLDDDIEGLWKIISSTHLYRNVEATASEISEKQAQFLTFAWIPGKRFPPIYTDGPR